MPKPTPLKDVTAAHDAALEEARRVLAVEIEGLTALSACIDENFARAVERLATHKGRAILAGVGKSGHVARKIAATLASTGMPAQFVHPTEASHGDLGMITREDTVIALSKSGETRELADIVGYCARHGIPLIAMTAKPGSLLGSAADIVLVLPDAAEACDVTQAPTTSTTLQMALGDALAVALLKRRGFTAKDFGDFHPGGSLGAALKTVAQLMHRNEEIPLVGEDVGLAEAIDVMSRKTFGCVGVVSADGRLAGVITDGDLRRRLGDASLLQKRAAEVMTASPRTIAPDALAGDALRRMTGESPQVTVLFVVKDGRPTGVLHMHDLLRAGLG